MCTFPAEVQPGAALLSFQQFYRDYHGMETAGGSTVWYRTLALWPVTVGFEAQFGTDSGNGHLTLLNLVFSFVK